MTKHSRSALKKLQRLDTRIAETRDRIGEFDPLFERVEEPALALESELTTARKRLQDMNAEERRLERSVEEKRARLKKLEDRLGAVRNLREEAAVSAETDMVKRALQGDEQEAYSLLDQIRRLGERVDDLDGAHREAEARVRPAREELVGRRREVEAELSALERERDTFAATMDSDEVRLYEGIRGGGRRVAVASLTEDGACGNCFGLVPPQIENEVCHGSALIRCEVCGVILSAPDPDDVEREAATVPASDDEASAAGGPGSGSDGAGAPSGERAAPE